ncbi:hypothetical protein C2S52_001276 [Perilla frutescens var. hirtella]|nr:hypothetical protein C2S52_001276 [Perilla frutescens var. hirtella]
MGCKKSYSTYELHVRLTGCRKSYSTYELHIRFKGCRKMILDMICIYCTLLLRQERQLHKPVKKEIYLVLSDLHQPNQLRRPKAKERVKDLAPCANPRDLIPERGIPHEEAQTDYFRHTCPPMPQTANNIGAFSKREDIKRWAEETTHQYAAQHYAPELSSYEGLFNTVTRQGATVQELSEAVEPYWRRWKAPTCRKAFNFTTAKTDLKPEYEVLLDITNKKMFGAIGSLSQLTQERPPTQKRTKKFMSMVGLVLKMSKMIEDILKFPNDDVLLVLVSDWIPKRGSIHLHSLKKKQKTKAKTISKNGSSADFQVCSDPNKLIPFIGIPHPDYGANYFRSTCPSLQLTEENIHTFYSGSSNPFPPTIVQVQRIMSHRLTNKIPPTALLSELRSATKAQEEAGAMQSVNCTISPTCRKLNFDNLSNQSAEPPRPTGPKARLEELTDGIGFASKSKRLNCSEESSEENPVHPIKKRKLTEI